MSKLTFRNYVPFGSRYGPGGRSSNSGITATVFGGYGFLGRYFINELGRRGTRVYIPFRGCELEVRHLKPMFDLGQLGLMPFSPRDEESIVASIQYSDIVVNMIGKYYETKHLVPTRRANGQLSNVNYDFHEVNVEIPRRLARLAKQAGVKSFVHISALSADANSNSIYSRTKAEGEIAVREEFPEAIIVKPAILFGPEDRFLNWIAEATNRLPFTPLVNNGDTIVQPVYSADVGKGLFNIVLAHSECAGKDFYFAGPAEYTMKEVVEFVSDVTTVNKPLIDIPIPLAKLAGKICQELYTPAWTEDMLLRTLEDNVLDEEAVKASNAYTLQDLGVEPASMDKVAFDYLHRFRPGGHFVLAKGYH